MENFNIMSDNYFMKHAIQIAEKGRWFTAPNPCVGAVLVHDNVIIAEGYHKEYGEAHAEIECLRDAIKQGFFQNESVYFSNPLLAKAYEDFKEKPTLSPLAEQTAFSFSMRDCVLYVTLEPCAHHGKTPPCTQAIMEAGIKRVVIGMKDINEDASGGIERLKTQGIAVTCGILEDKCRELIKDFLVWQTKKRPYVILKMACSLDGRIGPRLGYNHKLSCPKTRQSLMKLRENIGIAGGAVMVGANTFALDKPKLTARRTHDLNFTMPDALPVLMDKASLACLAKEEAPKIPIAYERRMPCYKHIAQPYAVVVSSKLPDTDFNLPVKGNFKENIANNEHESKNIFLNKKRSMLVQKKKQFNTKQDSSQKPSVSCLLQRPDETLWYCSHEAFEEDIFIQENDQNIVAQTEQSCQTKKEKTQSVLTKLYEKGVFVKSVSSCFSKKTKKNELNLQEILDSLFLDKACPYVLCEGGPHLAMSLLKHKLVDELILYMSPLILGDSGKPVFAGYSIDSLQDALGFSVQCIKQVGQDIHIHLKQEQICSQA